MALNTSSDGLKTVSLEWPIQWSALSLCFLGPRSLRPHGDPLSSHSRPNSEDWAPRCQDGCHRHAAETTTWRIGQENLINWINQRLSLLLVITLSSIAESVCLGVWCTVCCSLCSWRSVLRTWAALPSLWDPPWLSCSPVLHRAMNTTQVLYYCPGTPILMTAIPLNNKLHSTTRMCL